MACLRCGSAWTTRWGKDMVSCPECCKQQRCKARKQGRLPTSETKTCERCGRQFEAVGATQVTRKKCCSQCKQEARKEYLAARQDEATKRSRLHRDIASFMGSVRSVMVAQSAASARCRMRLENPPVVCRNCSKPFLPDARRSSRFCSWACCSEFAERRKCVTCGSEFELRAMGRGAKAKRMRPECSECVRSRWRKTPRGRAAAKKQEHRTRCRKYGVTYDPSVKPRLVFERDGYKCHVCKKKTLPRFALVGGKPHHRSPTIDHHPYPLSVGVCGHEWHNVKCCCWGCNVRKGAAWDGQLPLIR